MAGYATLVELSPKWDIDQYWQQEDLIDDLFDEQPLIDDLFDEVEPETDAELIENPPF